MAILFALFFNVCSDNRFSVSKLCRITLDPYMPFLKLIEVSLLLCFLIIFFSEQDDEV